MYLKKTCKKKVKKTRLNHYQRQYLATITKLQGDDYFKKNLTVRYNLKGQNLVNHAEEVATEVIADVLATMISGPSYLFALFFTVSCTRNETYCK